jgi:uncharacterized protein YndB with AHSA1/START domain/DNA-binding transcriptional ArsR family regulator
MDEVFKALADASRRRLLDSLNARNGQSLRELCAGLDMARQSVSKHLAVLEAAGLVTTVRRGREKLHYLNAAPVNAIADRWIRQYDRERVRALADLKTALERAESRPMETSEFVYTTYIRTTPERLWQALTDPAFTRRYWGVAFESDWRVGSPVKIQLAPGEEFRDLGSVVLESDPHRRLSFTDGAVPDEHAEHLGWGDEERARAQADTDTRTTFVIEPAGAAVKLTLVHGPFAPDSPSLEVYRESWPELLSSLKSLLETGDVLATA